ncbi:hypothetical protein [Desulfolithobacter sp.]
MPGSGKKKILASFDPDKLRWFMTTAKKSGGRLVFSGVKPDWNPTTGNKSDLYCCLNTPRTHLLEDEFPNLKKDLLTLQVNERIQQEGLYGDDTHFIHKIKKLGKQGERLKLSTVSIPSSDLEQLFESARLHDKSTIRRIVPAPVAIAGLLDQFTTKPVLAALFSGENLQLLLVKAGRPLYSQMVPPDLSGSYEETMLAQTFEIVRQNIFRQFALEVDRFICLGSHYDKCPPRIGGEEPWKPDWEAAFEAESVEDLYRFPELYGTWFAQPAYDLLPRSWKASYTAQKWGNILCSGLFCASAALAILTFYMHDDLKALRDSYGKLYDDIFLKQQEITAMLPQEEEKQLVERIVSIQEAAVRLPRVENILANIADIIPTTVKISSFTYQVDSGSPPASLPAPSAAPEHRSIIDQLEARTKKLTEGQGILRIRFTTGGNLEKVRTELKKSISGLAEKYQLENISWYYAQDSNRAFLDCDIKLTRITNR